MKCPSCGAEAAGNFCSACGNPLKRETCPACGAAVAPGTRFCTACGAQIRGGSGGGSATRKAGSGPRPGHTRETVGSPPGTGNLAWWVAGGLLIVVIVVLGLPVLTRGAGSTGGASAPSGMGGSTGGGTPVDLSTMTLEEQGTILFNRVMTSNSAGDTADVAFFLPKALIIYEQLAPTDADGRYHYALLYLVGGDFEAALAKAQEGLAEIPDYLLLLAAAGEASANLGDTAQARDYYGRFLDVYDSELELMRPGYEHHQAIFPVYREEARAFLGSG